MSPKPLASTCFRPFAFATLGLLLPLSAQTRLPLHSEWTFAVATAAGERPPAAAYQPVALPSAWEAHAGIGFDGIGWYRRHLRSDPAWQGKQLRLLCHGAATAARVYLNGTEVGQHLGAWTPFRVELTPAWRWDADNLLEIRLDEKVGHNTQGFHPIIQPHFGGLWQELELCVDGAAVIDRESVLALGEGEALRLQVPVLAAGGPGAPPVRVQARVFAQQQLVASSEPFAPGEHTLAVPGARPWSPREPNLYRVEIVLFDAHGEPCDRIAVQTGFRQVRTEGTRLLWNGTPLAVRGMLHWGFEPDRLAPHRDKAHWRAQMELLRARGFNLVKACLWIPPRAFYEAADEVGMLVWQEYPTWHPRFDAAHRAELLAEFEEFYRYDRSHPSVAFRSLTCETGHGAELEVIQGLYARAHAVIPNSLIVDDSSWIEWNRVHDFWDDHPYGNNSWWPGKLAYFAQYIADHGKKPLLLGEAITGDTWVDLAAWTREHGDQERWWAPRCLAAQRAFEPWYRDRHGADALARIRPDSLAYVLRNRKYQIERLRLALPDAGYVVSVLRDVTLARMGLLDPFGTPKWSSADFAWQGDTMLCLDTEADRRAFVAGPVRLPVRISHYGATSQHAPLRLELDGRAGAARELTLAPGSVSAAIAWEGELAAAGDQPRRVMLSATWGECANSWPLWVLPAPAPMPKDVSVVHELSAQTLQRLREGARVLLLASDRKHSLRTRAHQYYRGAPLCPPHPLHAQVPAEFLCELQTFDLEGPRVLEWEQLVDQVDPIFGLWDTHDDPVVRKYLLAFATRVGAGRLLVSSFAHASPAGQFLLQRFAAHLQDGPPPRQALADRTLEHLQQALAAEILDLPDWELKLDPQDLGLGKDYAAGTASDGGWTAVKAGAHWEKQGFAHQDGIGWYRTAFTPPVSWQGRKVTLVCEGVDDSFRLYLNGKELGRFGDPVTKQTVWLERQTCDLSPHLRLGESNRIVLRVVDHAGAGGLWKPVFLTTGAVDAPSDLLH